jgi:hypothetical protein
MFRFISEYGKNFWLILATTIINILHLISYPMVALTNQGIILNEWELTKKEQSGREEQYF